MHVAGALFVSISVEACNSIHSHPSKACARLLKNGSLARFSRQGLEKLNGESFFSGTNHYDRNALQQM